MSWTLLAWRLLAHRPAVALLNLAALALGLAALVFVMVSADQVSARFARDLRGVDLVVGAKGSPLQLILAGVFHLDIPPGNIPAGLEAEMAALPTVARAIPLSLGDSFRGHRIVGTRHGLIEQHGASLAAGRLWEGPMQAVLGASVAQDTGLALGASLVGQHGLGEGGGGHDAHPLTVVGVLAPTGGVIDRLILTDVTTVWQVHEKAVALDDDDRRELEAARFGIRLKNLREIAGQIPRLIFGGVKSFVGRIPVGNTGGADVSALQPMPIPADLAAIIASARRTPPNALYQ